MRRSMRTRFWGTWPAALAVVLLLFAAPLFADEVDFLDDEAYETPEEAIASIYDPLEPFNRVMFTINDCLYLWVLDPVATGYSYVVPKDFRTIISNFFYNLGEPVRAVNCLLQGRLADTGLALSRFLINSTAGVFGLADPAGNEFKIAKRQQAGLANTFAAWGIGDGLYLVIPLVGPTTLRDLTGTVGDSLGRGLYLPWSDDWPTSVSVFAGQTVNEVSQRLGQYQELKAMTLDPYVAFRNGYAQMRQQQSVPQNGNPAELPTMQPPSFQIDVLDINYNQ